jgi:dTDP-4-dehydrorhamnose 3,5-epimerase
MIVRETAVAGAFVLEPERLADERGFFARTFSAAEFGALGLDPAVAERSVAYNAVRGTLRGLHYQAPPHQETKLVRCVRGAAYDVAVDLRPGSPTHLRWAAAELTGENGLGFYIPAGCAHGYLTLSDETELDYQISVPHAPAAASGVRWDDPVFGIAWPGVPEVISPRDASYPDYTPDGDAL